MEKQITANLFAVGCISIFGANVSADWGRNVRYQPE